MTIAAGLGNLMPGGIYRVPWDQYSHLDFLWGMDAKPLVYDPVIEMMKSLE